VCGRTDVALPRTDGERKEQMKMDEERDIAKNLAEALREVKAMREGRLPERTWTELKAELDAMIIEEYQQKELKVV